MPTSQNGWTASPNLALRPLVVNGVAFAPGIRDDDDVETVLRYVAEQYVARVEPLMSPGCWGFSYRANRNDPDALSNHSSGTALDVNAPQHPNGTPPTHTFTPDQIGECRAIVAELDGAVRWGGDYRTTPDPMHFELDCDAAGLAVVARRLREEADVSPEQEDRIVKRVIDGLLAAPIGGDKDPATFKQAQNQIRTDVNAIRAAVKKNRL